MQSRESDDESSYELMDIPKSPNISVLKEAETVSLEMPTTKPSCFIVLNQHEQGWRFHYGIGYSIEYQTERFILRDLINKKLIYTLHDHLDVNIEPGLFDDDSDEELNGPSRLVVEFDLDIPHFQQLINTNIQTVWKNIIIRNKNKEAQLMEEVSAHIVGIYRDIQLQDQNHQNQWYRETTYELTRNQCATKCCAII